MAKRVFNITPETTWSEIKDIYPIVPRETKLRLFEEVQKYYNCVFWEQKISMILELISGNFPITYVNENAFCVIFFDALKNFIDDLVSVVKRYSVSSGEGVNSVQYTFKESILIEMQSYFKCPSFADVYNMYIADYILMKKVTYNNYVSERKMLQRLKSKRK